MKLQVTHETRYDYQTAVEIAQHLGHLRPVDSARQQVLAHHLDITPHPVQCLTQTDVFGNLRQWFDLHQPHRQLLVQAQSVVQTRETPEPPSSVEWEAVKEGFEYYAQAPYDPAVEFVFASPRVPLLSAFADYADASLVSGHSLLQAATDLMERIHHEFVYDGASTEVSTPVLQALQQRRGVCQDFAHIMIAALRAHGLAARYVSGYLLTQTAPGQARMRGTDASHAWVSVYLPDLPEGKQWVDFDPTNNRFGWGAPGADYIVLATGRDFDDVSPLRGVIHGGGEHRLTVGVTVEDVDAEP